MPAVLRESVELGIPGGIVISAGFKETGAPGIALEREIMEIVSGKMRIIGPNCLGVMNPVQGLNATFAATVAKPGNVAFMSQSGALCTAVLDWSLHENVGFSSFISIGSMLDVNWGDLISYFGNDPRTNAIVIYMESIGDASSLPFGSARSLAHQAHHRHQGRAHCCCRQGRRLAHRLAHRLRRCSGRRLPPRRRAARQLHRGSFST